MLEDLRRPSPHGLLEPSPDPASPPVQERKPPAPEHSRVAASPAVEANLGGAVPSHRSVRGRRAQAQLARRDPMSVPNGSARTLPVEGEVLARAAVPHPFEAKAVRAV